MSVEDPRWARAYLSRVAEPASLPIWHLVERVGPQQAADMIARGQGGDDVSAASAARRGISIEDDLDAALRHDIRLLTPEDEDWPHFAFASLNAAARGRWASWAAGERTLRPGGESVPPFALWVKGLVDPAELGVGSVAIVGARAATSYGLHVAADLSYDLAQRGMAIVSGGAFGIDAAAHRSALAAEAATVLVSAGGLDRAYPLAHSALFEQVAQSGLLISESPPGSAPFRRRFLSRNRLIAAFGSGTVVVEAGRRSGALNTAAHARRLGRPLLVVPGPVTSALSVGCHDLLRAEPDSIGSSPRLVTCAADVLSELTMAAGSYQQLSLDASMSPMSPMSPTPQIPHDIAGGRSPVARSGAGRDPAGILRAALDELTPDAAAVYDALRPRRWSTDDEIASRSGVAHVGMRAALASLLVRGLAEAGPEGYRLGRP